MINDVLYHVDCAEQNHAHEYLQDSLLYQHLYEQE